jgi:hypothetical protein
LPPLRDFVFFVLRACSAKRNGNINGVSSEPWLYAKAAPANPLYIKVVAYDLAENEGNLTMERNKKVDSAVRQWYIHINQGCV